MMTYVLPNVDTDYRDVGFKASVGDGQEKRQGDEEDRGEELARNPGSASSQSRASSPWRAIPTRCPGAAVVVFICFLNASTERKADLSRKITCRVSNKGSRVQGLVEKNAGGPQWRGTGVESSKAKTRG